MVDRMADKSHVINPREYAQYLDAARRYHIPQFRPSLWQGVTRIQPARSSATDVASFTMLKICVDQMREHLRASPFLPPPPTAAKENIQLARVSGVPICSSQKERCGGVLIRGATGAKGKSTRLNSSNMS